MHHSNAAIGLDLFAVAWVERWTIHGGSMTVSGEGNIQLFARVNSTDVPGYDLPATLTDEQRRQRREIDDWMLCGRTRELMSLLDAVPGGRDAVKAHVRSFPSAAYHDGTVELA